MYTSLLGKSILCLLVLTKDLNQIRLEPYPNNGFWTKHCMIRILVFCLLHNQDGNNKVLQVQKKWKLGSALLKKISILVTAKFIDGFK